MAITVNTVSIYNPESNSKEWHVCAQSADSTGNETLKAAETGLSHSITRIRVDMCPGAAAASFTINDDAAAVIGPVDLIDTGATSYEYEFNPPVKFTAGQAIKLDTEAADQIHVTLSGFTEK